MTRLISANKRELQVASQKHELRISELEAENKKLADDLKRVEEQYQLTRSVASEGNKLAAREVSELKKSLSELTNQLFNANRDLIHQHEESARNKEITEY
jgi:hypothetical protein